MKKKLLSLFVAAVMVFSMLPLGVFAAPDAPSVREMDDPEYVSVIEINDLTIPAWGASPDFDVTAGSDAYTVELVRWFDANGEIEPSFIFEDEANEFYASFEVSANPGYTFSPNTRVFINGSEELVNFSANECADNGTAFHTESVPFTVEREIITEVEIEGFTAPVNGENPFYAVTAPEGANYSVGETNWYCGDDLVEPGTPFVFGNTYWMEIELIPNYGYKFGDELTAAVDGDEALVDEAVVESPESAWVITVELEVAAAVINAVELLELELPECGALADYDLCVPEGAAYSIESVRWFYPETITIEDKVELFPGNPVVAGYGYQMVIELTPNDGFAFADEVYVTINGDGSLVFGYYVYEGGSKLAVGSIDFSFGEAIDEAGIEGFAEPVWGEAACYDYPVPEGANYSVAKVYWCYWDGEEVHFTEEGLIFDNEEYEYFMIVDLFADDGYYFGLECFYTVNGEAYEPFAWWSDYSYIHIDGTDGVRDREFAVGPFTVEREIIEEIAIEGFVEPVWGDAPNYDVTVPEGANYTVDEVQWFYWVGEEFHEMEEGQLFDNEEYEYFMTVTFAANYGYRFANGFAYAINGEEYSYEDFDFDKYGWEIALAIYGNLSNDMRAWRVVGPFTVTEPELIEEVAIEGFVEPVWGEAPNYDVTVPEGANYTISEVRWIYYAADGSSFGNEMQEGELFDKEDVVYYMEVTFIPNDGYKFAAELSYTVNGGSEYEESWTASDYDVAFLMVLQFTVTEPESETLWGDADGDGEVTTADALLLMRYLIGADTVEEENLALCDVNGDGEINLVDALLIMRKAMGTIDAFPVED